MINLTVPHQVERRGGVKALEWRRGRDAGLEAIEPGSQGELGRGSKW